MDCDILIPVGKDLAQLRLCLESLLAHTPSDAALIHLFTEQLDDATEAYVQQVVSAYDAVQWHRLKHPYQGLALFQQALLFCQHHYVVYLQPTVLLPQNWLPRLYQVAQHSKSIAQVIPLNASRQTALPLLQGANVYSMDTMLQTHTATYPAIDIHWADCFLCSRMALQGLGNQAFKNPQQFAQSLRSRAYHSVVHDGVYVAHIKHYPRSKQIINSLPDVIKKIPQRWTPMPSIWQTYRALLTAWHQRQFIRLGMTAVQGAWAALNYQQDHSTALQLHAVLRPQRLRVTYVLNKVLVAGGVLSVIQLVNGLIQQGIEARIVAVFEDPDLQAHWRMLCRPIVFKNAAELIQDCPETDILVATHWTTAAWVKAIDARGGCLHSAYFIQDYESWFYPESDTKTRQQVMKTYAWIPHKIVKSAWLQDLLKNDGFDSQKIHLGMNLECFYPRHRPKKSTPTILAMARPNTARRGFPSVIAALHAVKQRHPEIQIILFGDNRLAMQTIPFDYIDCGVINDQNTLANYYSQADIFLDGSDYQGFGRLGLEAMACGTLCVLTGVGGVNEYARHAQNCLLVEPQQVQQFAQAIERLLNDEVLSAHLLEGGFETVKHYDMRRETGETADYFMRLADIAEMPHQSSNK